MFTIPKKDYPSWWRFLRACDWKEKRKRADIKNPIFNRHPRYRDFSKRSKWLFNTRMGLILPQILLFMWFLAGAGGALQQLDEATKRQAPMFFILSMVGCIGVIVAFVSWAERSIANRPDRAWAKGIIRQLTSPVEISVDGEGQTRKYLSSPVLTMNEIAAELQTDCVNERMEIMKKKYAALLAEGIGYHALLEFAICRKDREFLTYMLEHRLSILKSTMDSMVWSPFFALVATAFLLEFTRVVKAVNNPAFPVLVLFSLGSCVLTTIWLYQGRDAGALVKPLSFILSLIVLCAGAYEGIVTYRLMVQAQLKSKEVTPQDHVPLKIPVLGEKGK